MSESNFRITNKRRHTYQRGDSFVIVDGLASCDGLVQSSFHRTLHPRRCVTFETWRIPDTPDE